MKYLFIGGVANGEMLEANPSPVPGKVIEEKGERCFYMAFTYKDDDGKQQAVYVWNLMTPADGVRAAKKLKSVSGKKQDQNDQKNDRQ